MNRRFSKIEIYNSVAIAAWIGLSLMKVSKGAKILIVFGMILLINRITTIDKKTSAENY